MDPLLLCILHEHPDVGARVELVQQGRQGGPGGEAGAGRDDGKTVQQRQGHHPQLVLTAIQGVLDRGPDAIARSALDTRIARLGVQSRRGKPLVQRIQRASARGLTVGGGDGLDVVVDVAPSVGILHVVADGDRRVVGNGLAIAEQQPHLVEHRVPVVVAVHEHDVGGEQVRQHLEAQGLVEAADLAPARHEGRRVEFRSRIDDVERGAGTAAPSGELGALLSCVGSDLDDPLRPGRGQQGTDHRAEEPIHQASLRQYTPVQSILTRGV